MIVIRNSFEMSHSDLNLELKDNLSVKLHFYGCKKMFRLSNLGHVLMLSLGLVSYEVL